MNALFLLSYPAHAMHPFSVYFLFSPWTTRRRSLAVGAVSTTAIVAGLLVAGGVALAASIVGGGVGGGDPRVLTRSGMDKFRRNLVEVSVEDFDRVIELAPQMRP